MISLCRHLFAVSAVFCSVTWGQANWKDSNRKDIEKVLTEYSDIFVGKAYDRLKDVCQVPFVRVDDRETVALRTMEEVIELYRQVREPLDARGYKTSRLLLSETRISVLSATQVLVNLPYDRYKIDGSLLERGSGFYILSKSSGTWKISGVLSQDPSQTGKVY